MRQLLISALLLSLLAGCASTPIGPHRIDVQQGNALDQENVARLKPGLNRSQVRFLLGTPLVVDPFRNDRWDYVYVYHKAGRLAEQKRLTLFFEGDVLARIEGDLPPAGPAPEQQPVSQPLPAPQAQPRAPAAPVVPERSAPVAPAAPSPVQPAPEPVSKAPAAAAPVAAAAATAPSTSIVPPLPSPRNVPPYPNKRPPAELALQAETDVAQIRPDVIPPFPEPATQPAFDAAVLAAVKAWSDAWARRDEAGYFAAYDAGFLPQGGGSRDEWEKRRRLLLGVARNVDLRIESPTVERVADGEALVTFNQHYRSDSYRDSVVKQLRLVERDGRWLITEERVLTILRGARP